MSKKRAIVARTEVVEVIRINIRDRQPSELLADLIRVLERQREGWQPIALSIEVMRGAAEKSL